MEQASSLGREFFYDVRADGLSFAPTPRFRNTRHLVGNIM